MSVKMTIFAHFSRQTVNYPGVLGVLREADSTPRPGKESETMRPTKQETDLEFWLNSHAHWTAQAEQMFLATAGRGLTPDDIRFFEERETKAREMAFRAQLGHQEATGVITVYTGRAKPAWAVA